MKIPAVLKCAIASLATVWSYAGPPMTGTLVASSGGTGGGIAVLRVGDTPRRFDVGKDETDYIFDTPGPPDNLNRLGYGQILEVTVDESKDAQTGYLATKVVVTNRWDEDIRGADMTVSHFMAAVATRQYNDAHAFMSSELRARGSVTTLLGMDDGVSWPLTEASGVVALNNYAVLSKRRSEIDFVVQGTYFGPSIVMDVKLTVSSLKNKSGRQEWVITEIRKVPVHELQRLFFPATVP